MLFMRVYSMMYILQVKVKLMMHFSIKNTKSINNK